MLFSSVTFLVFFLPATLILYFLFPNRVYRNCVLFFMSLLFYSWGEPKFVFLMLASITFNFFIGLYLGNRYGKRKILVILSILANIAILFIFKYLGFTLKIFDIFLESLHIKPILAINLIMPIGISFYTFQEISYLVDVYKNPCLAQKNFLNLGLYISFFPQLIAGPIVRYHDINNQIDSRQESFSLFAEGLERFIIGLSKKVILANSFALVCDKIFSASYESYGTYLAWLAAIAYAFQIYYDFSGYSDMAIGLAKLFGFNLLENFNYPYAASSINDFWKRWHISLTNFFRDYVYIPLGGNRKGKKRTIINRFIVFLTTGLWHGAAFNFIIWGLFHGIFMTIEKWWNTTHKHSKNILLKTANHFFTLLLILLLWVIFRNNLKESIIIILKMFGINYSYFTSVFRPISVNKFLLLYIDIRFFILLGLGFIFAFPWWRKIILLTGKNIYFIYIKILIKYFVLIILFVICYANLANNAYNPFIYFRF